MSEKFKLKGLCVCGHNPEEDPNEDCERCWLVTQILDAEIAAVEQRDFHDALRAERDRLREACEMLARRGHHDTCQELFCGYPCNCGYSAARVALASEPRP